MLNLSNAPLRKFISRPKGWITWKCTLKSIKILIIKNFKGGFNGQQPNFQHQIWALSWMPAHMDDIPPQSPWPVLFENGCRFSLVAMVTRLGLWLVKHGNKRNSKTNFRSTFKLGTVVHKNNSHKTMKPDFWCGCHGNQEAANQGILWRNFKFEQKIKKSSSWFCRYWSSAYVYQKSCK